jgi:hypothetical protein
MPDPTPPPVEWVPGPRLWWLPRLLPLAVGLAIYLTVAGDVLLFGVPFPSSTYGFEWVFLPVVLLVPVLFVVLWQFLARVPSVRNLGIAPWGLTLDFGITTETHSWSEVYSLVRTVETHYQGREAVVARGMRLRLSGHWMAPEISLSPQQADRVARFLRIA